MAIADRDVAVRILNDRMLELDATKQDVASLRQELAEMALIVHEQLDATPAAVPVPQPTSWFNLSMLPLWRHN